MRLEQPKTYSYSAYVKAGLAFVASTAAFLLAKTTPNVFLSSSPIHYRSAQQH